MRHESHKVSQEDILIVFRVNIWVVEHRSAESITRPVFYTMTGEAIMVMGERIKGNLLSPYSTTMCAEVMGGGLAGSLGEADDF